MQEEVDAKRVKLGKEADKVLKAAAEPIDRPGHHHVELALSSIPAKRIECRAFVTPFGAANAVVLVDFDDLAAHSGCNLLQFALLIGRRLVDGRTRR